jgi:hypothetical protein
MTKSFLAWGIKTLFFIFFSTVLLSISCRLEAVYLTVIFGLLFGWLSVQNTYMSVNKRMTILADILYFLSIGIIIYLSVQAIPYWCSIFPEVRSCGERLQGGCAILFSLPMGITSFSLWLWLRIRHSHFLEWGGIVN